MYTNSSHYNKLYWYCVSKAKMHVNKDELKLNSILKEHATVENGAIKV